jgi:AAA domain
MPPNDRDRRTDEIRRAIFDDCEDAQPSPGKNNDLNVANGRDPDPPASFDRRAPALAKPEEGEAREPLRVVKPKRRFPLVRFKDLKLATSALYLVDDLVPREGLIVVWGPPKCGKSFWTFDVVMHVALGWEYRGRRVEQGMVVYIAAEGERGIHNRVEAFRQKRLAEDGADPPFYLLTTRLDLVNDIDQLVGDIKAQLPDDEPCAVIVLDTLNRTIHGSESKDDMGAYRDAADRLAKNSTARLSSSTIAASMALALADIPH